MAEGVDISERLTAILPCSDVDASETFFGRLGFTRADDCPDEYRILADGHGGHMHLLADETGWLVPGCNPYGLYLYREDVDGLAAAFAGKTIEKGGVSHKPWGTYEFALNGPDDLLVRIGWPSRLVTGTS